MPHAPNGDLSIYYETFGSPEGPAGGSPPLLLINGFGSQCINFKADWCEKFVAAGFFVIRFDNRDVGLSSKCIDSSQSRYTIADMATDAVAVLDAAEVERAHVMGLSMGGMIVQQMGIDRPERMLSLISVMSTTSDPDVGRPDPEALAFLTGPAPKTRQEYIDRHVAANRVYGSPACFDPDRLAANAAEAFDRCFCPEGQARQMQAIVAAPSRTEALGGVKMPALVLHGDEDRLVDISGGERTASAIAGARFVVMEGMGHDYPPQYWDRYVAEVSAVAGQAGTGR